MEAETIARAARTASPPTSGPPLVPASVPVVFGHKALPLGPGFGYNPYSFDPDLRQALAGRRIAV
jgi:hypothetical protein